MARKNTANPFAAYAWFAEAGWVFAMHSAQLWADPATASARLAALGIEKQKAFAEGAMKASIAAMRGATPDTVARAAMAPARRRVRANARKIQKGQWVGDGRKPPRILHGFASRCPGGCAGPAPGRPGSRTRLSAWPRLWDAAAMTVGILETGWPPAALRAQWGSYGDMIRAMLGCDRTYRSYDVQAGELPADPAECSAYVITGSPAGVHDDLPWIPPFLDALRRVRGGAKLVGIGFGHQAMAQAFGGGVARSPEGWAVGMQRREVVRPSPGLREPLGFAIPAFHQDQVVALPPGARVLAASKATPFAAIGYDDSTVSVQGHPEFSPAFCAALIEAQRDVYGPLAGPALLSLLQPGDGERAAIWLRQFIDGGGLDTPG